MNNANTKVGIVIVSHNASEAVRITLASLRRAFNETPFNLILIDNASELLEREKIRADMMRHIIETGSSWCYIEKEKNLGFAGANNIGISRFLQNEEISHICLLNSDVIVTDHWLDRLLANGFDIVSAVTNRADSEQCIPVDYQIEIGECLDKTSGVIYEEIYKRVSDFSERWYKAWCGNSVETEPTFFCVLLTQEVFHTIGLLDETFFPGGFEDDDYCFRAKQAGYRPHLARDVFIHHWGSVSFSQLSFEYLNTHSLRNKEYLEKKHGFVWKPRPEKPITSMSADINFALQHQKHIPLQKQFIDLHIEQNTKRIAFFESNYSKFKNMLSTVDYSVPETLAFQITATDAYGDLNILWKEIVLRIKHDFSLENHEGFRTASIVSDLAYFEKAFYEKAECAFSMNTFIANARTLAKVEGNLSRRCVVRYFRLLLQGFKFICKFNGIVFFGGYPYEKRQNDGYFQRIKIIDRLFIDVWRIYVETDVLKGRNCWFDRPEKKVLVLRIIGTKKRRIFILFLSILTVFRCRKIYFHSVLRMRDNWLGLLLRLPFIRKAVDMHGAVSEEFRMHNDFSSAILFEKEEEIAVKKAGLIVVVTDAMRQYFKQKFQNSCKGKIISFPMFPDFTPTITTRPLIEGKPVVVYAGGLHKWQQINKMIDAIIQTADCCIYRFYCPDPQTVKNMLPVNIKNAVVVESKTHTELIDIYPKCHYGFILREDSIVNRVACPTKLVEYLAMGIVPIVDYEDIGDFKTLAMHFVRLKDFLAGNLPSEEQRLEMAIANFKVYKTLKETRQAGAEEIKNFFR